VIKDNKVLLVKHTYRPGWFFPGGGIKKGEPHHDAALRELREETGIIANKVSLFGTYVYKGEGKYDNVICFLCKDFEEGNRTEDTEIGEARWFDINDLPIDVFPGTERRIDEYRSGTYPSFGFWV
jgi:8-oxo-dGTP pyrophosphatase MutT (NUDIX family)